MPMTTKKGKPKKSELPSTVARSGKKARATFAHAYDSAMDEYGEADRARRVAWSALEQTHEKVGDRWKKKPKDEAGVSTDSSKAHLYKLAQQLDIDGRSTMSKRQLVSAIHKANKKATSQARG
jgi:cation transport regulator ChaB